jgi:adenylylsulfate reductase subunit A
MANFKTEEVNTDLLIVGGGMAACGAAVEAAYWAKKNGLKVTMVDKAAVDRSGAVAMGLSAINQYVGIKDGKNTVEDYVKYVRSDLMGITREDLVYNIARHVDSSVHLFEKWGLPIWKDADDNYVHEGKWQLMINGESYKVIVARQQKVLLALKIFMKEYLLLVLLWTASVVLVLLASAFVKKSFISLKLKQYS